MAVIIHENGTTRREHEGRVIGHGERYRHVCSDNAMIDSGFVRDAFIWDGRRVVVESYDLGRAPDGYGVTVEDDAPAAARELAGLYELARAAAVKVTDAWAEYRRAEREAAKVTKGCTVRVVKGRKVPKGTVARVYYEGANDYGPYVHLESDDRTQAWRYVNPENLEVVGGGPARPRYSEEHLRLARLALGLDGPRPGEADPEALALLGDALYDAGLTAEAAPLADYMAAVLCPAG